MRCLPHRWQQPRAPQAPDCLELFLEAARRREYQGGGAAHDLPSLVPVTKMPEQRVENPTPYFIGAGRPPVRGHSDPGRRRRLNALELMISLQFPETAEEFAVEERVALHPVACHSNAHHTLARQTCSSAKQTARSCILSQACMQSQLHGSVRPLSMRLRSSSDCLERVPQAAVPLSFWCLRTPVARERSSAKTG